MNKNTLYVISILFFLFLLFSTLNYFINNIENIEDKSNINTTISDKNKYDRYDIEFHSSLMDIYGINEKTDPLQANLQEVPIQDKYGNNINIKISNTLGNPLYYKPGTFKYDSTNYIPTYEDSIYLSKTYNKK